MLTEEDFIKEFRRVAPGDLIVVDTDDYNLSDHYLTTLRFGINGDACFWEFELVDPEDNLLTIRCESTE
jgi:hypothetical protein